MPRTLTHTWFFFGDSLTLGVNDNEVPGGWVSRLAMLAGKAGLCKYPPATFYNLGARRQKTADIASRWKAEVKNRDMPGIVSKLLFCVGVVDMAGPLGAEAKSTTDALAALEQILTDVKNFAPALIVSPPPIANPEARQRIAALCPKQAEICGKFSIPYVNINAELENCAAYMNDLADGLHPGPQGSLAMADLLFSKEEVKNFLRESKD